MMPLRPDPIQFGLITSPGMSTRLTRADVERIAALAHLDLTEEETALFASQLAQILEYAERLKDVDTSAVTETWNSGSSTSLRPDTLRPSLARDDALANAPDSADGHFRVPQVIDE